MTLTTIRRMALGCLVPAALLSGTATAHAAPMEWAWIGPYASTWTCEQARDSWPEASKPCVLRAGGAYFYGLRQAG